MFIGYFLPYCTTLHCLHLCITLRSTLYLSVFMKVAQHTKIRIVTMNDFKRWVFADERAVYIVPERDREFKI